MSQQYVIPTALLLVGVLAGVAWSLQRPPARRLMCTMKVIQEGTRHYTICVIEPEPKD